MKAEEKRKILKEYGWIITDRTSQGIHIELWVNPNQNSMYPCAGISLISAWKKISRNLSNSRSDS